ncbi:carbohydrate binding domain-containing protein [Pseudomonas gingeri]
MNDYVDPLLPSHDPLQDDAPSQERTFDLTRPEHYTPVPFKELPLYIPNLTTPVIGFDGGINRAALDAHRDKGLLCILRPYLDMAENDFIELFCRDITTPVAVHTVSDIEVANGSLLPLYIPRARLPDGSADPVFFRVTRVDGNTEETGRFRLKVDTVAPGGRNPVASTYQNENLPMPVFPQDLIDFGVGESDIGTPVPVRIDFYPAVSNPAPDINRAVRDRIRLSIGGYIIEHPVTEGEIESTDPITVWINTGDWAKIGSGEHVCEYEVIDEVGNYSDGWSPAQLLEVRLDDQAEPLLYEPYVEESDEHNELDADALEGADATIVVALHRADFAVDDIVRVTLNGRTFEGQRVTRHIEHTVVASELGRTARIPWKNSDILPLIKGRVQVSYERIRSSAPNRGSHSVIVYVVGTQAGSDLPAPRVDDAPGNVLPPEVPFLIVNIQEYVGQDPFDRVILVLDGTYASGLPYYREVDDIAGTGDIVFRLQNGPNGEIARLEGGTLLLYYFVENDSGKRRSEELLLDVGEPLASMPPVKVDEAPPPDQVFDPETSLFDARVLVLPNVDIIQNDTVTLYAEGSAAGGSAPPFPFHVTATWVGRELPFTVRRQYILPNLDRSMRLYYTVARDGARTRFSHPFIMKVGSALDLPVPKVLESTITGPDTATINPLHVDSPPVVTIRVEYSPMYPSDNITVHWVGKPGIGTPNITPKPGSISGQVDFTAPSSAVAAAIGGDCQVSYSVERGGATTASDTLQVSVSEFSAGDLPRPEFYVDNVQLISGTLDVTRSIKMRLPSWPLIDVGQKVWLVLEGFSYNYTLWDAFPVSPEWIRTGYAEIPVPASYLNKLGNNSSLLATPRVTFDHSSVVANATVFPLRIVTVQNQSSVIIIIDNTSFENNTTGRWTRGNGAANSYFATALGNRVLRCPTTSANNSGAVLTQTFQLTPNRRHRFHCQVRRYQELEARPLLTLRVNGTVIHGPVTIQGTNWTTLSGEFTPTSSSTTLALWSELATSAGNDFDVNYIALESIA